MVERFNRMNEQQKDWDENIPRFLLAYRSAVHDSTPKSPAKIIFGTEIKLPGDLEFGVQPTTEDDTTYARKEQSINELHEFVRTRIKMVSDRMKARYDLAANTKDFQEGQLVLLYNPQRKKGLSPSYKPAGMDRIK